MKPNSIGQGSGIQVTSLTFNQRLKLQADRKAATARRRSEVRKKVKQLKLTPAQKMMGEWR